jgi:hypothetical protein
MATGSGLDAQLGVAPEVTWGAAATPTRFPEFVSESMAMSPSWLEPSSIRAGQKYKRGRRVRQSRRTVGGDIVLEHATLGMGLFWKHALASSLASPTQLEATTAYQQIHTPGDHRGLGLTVQIGRPEPGSGLVKPFTYSGCKVLSWEFQLRDQETPQFSLTLDGKDEIVTTPLVVPSFLAGASVFDFSQATLRLGGSTATNSGLATVTGGAAVATIINEITIAGEAPMASERFGLGNAGLKAEQIENDIPTVTGSLGAEFNQAELYDAFAGNYTQAIELEMVGAPIGDSGYNEKLVITMPACKIKSAAPQVGGPDIVTMSSDFEAYDDESNAPIQVVLVSGDTAL